MVLIWTSSIQDFWPWQSPSRVFTIRFSETSQPKRIQNMANMKRKYESDTENDNANSKRNLITIGDSNSENQGAQASSGHENNSTHDDSTMSSDLSDLDSSFDEDAASVGASEQDSSDNEVEASDSEIDDSDDEDGDIESGNSENEASDDEASDYDPDQDDDENDEVPEEYESESDDLQPPRRGNRRKSRRRSRARQNLEEVDASYHLDQSFTHTFNIRNVDTTYNFTLRSDAPNFETQEEFHRAILNQLGPSESTPNWVKYGTLPFAGRYANWVPIDSNAWPLTPL
ncbi:hypothetical protein BZA77DRAFT_290187 [Pyronema omphalodes]|nr:hypothetical protein BZA77DRAFT_290187 [Pyronema omphalodes]